MLQFFMHLNAKHSFFPVIACHSQCDWPYLILANVGWSTVKCLLY